MSTWYQHNQEDYFVNIPVFEWNCALSHSCKNGFAYSGFVAVHLPNNGWQRILRWVGKYISCKLWHLFIYLSIYMCHNDGVFTFYVSWYTVIVMFTLRICRGIGLVWIMHIFIKSMINTCSKAIKGSFTNLSYLMTFKSLNYLLQKTNQRWKQSIKEAINWKY